MIQEFTVEELKTAIGYLMSDLRGNWGYEYTERMEEVKSLLETLIDKDSRNATDYTEDLITTNEEIEEPQDGRIFRDSCTLYCYSSEEGKTVRVKEYIEKHLTHPEYYSFEVDA